MKRRTLAGIVISAFIALAPISNAHLSEKQIEATNSTGLVYKLSEQEGLRQLKELAINSSKEDGWFYIPEIREWVDNGYFIKEDSFEVDDSVIFDRGISEVIHYHIHPVPDSPSDLDFWPYNVLVEELRNVAGFFPPSDEDIAYFLESMKVLEDRGVVLKECRVVDSKGYWAVNIINSKLVEEVRPDFHTEYNKLLADHIHTYTDLYRLNREKDFGPFERWLIDNFEREASKLGLDLEYHYLK